MYDEITDGQLAALTLFVAMQPAPTSELPSRPDLVDLCGAGVRLFGELGCTSCHVPALPLARKLYALALGGEAEPIQVDLEREGARPIPPRSAVDGVRRLSLYSDLRRHAMGAELSEPADTDRVPGDPFLTPPLWSVARSRPYLQDGRAANLEAGRL